jgi:adenylate cyclase
MTTRHLAAIVVGGMVGYSRLMGADEEGTLSWLQVLRGEMIDPALMKQQPTRVTMCAALQSIVFQLH